MHAAHIRVQSKAQRHALQVKLYIRAKTIKHPAKAVPVQQEENNIQAEHPRERERERERKRHTGPCVPDSKRAKERRLHMHMHTATIETLSI